MAGVREQRGRGEPADPAAEARALLDPARAVGEAAALVDDLLRSRQENP